MTDNQQTIVLLGAGSSREAGVPTTFEMTEKLVKGVGEASRPGDAISSALHFVCASLMAHDAATAGQSPSFAGLDVERVFTAVELLAERRELEITPFVASWHPGVDAWDAASASAPTFFDGELKKAILSSPSFGSAEKLITALVDARTGSAADGAMYRRLAEAMIAQLRELVATTPKDVGYLAPLAEASRQRGLTIATLNYDLSVEQAAEVSGVPCATGVESWLRTGSWDWPTNGIRLLKLHGSIDWVWADTQHQPGYMPQRAIFLKRELEEGEEWQPALVFGNRGKLRAEGPFLSLLGELETLMRGASHLVIIGYSFRDDHVNEIIQRWTSEDIGRTVTVVDPKWPERFFGDACHEFRATMHEHLIPYESGPQFPSRLRIVRDTCSEALPVLL
jgi:hypothetical protein